MSVFPVPDPRYGEVLTARRVPREQWRHYHKGVRGSLHCCQTSQHRPADSQNLHVCIGTLASQGHTAAPRAQAQCAVDDNAVCLSPEVQSLRDDAVAPSAPNDGDDGLAARTQERVMGHSPRMEAHAPVLGQANGA